MNTYNSKPSRIDAVQWDGTKESLGEVYGPGTTRFVDTDLELWVEKSNAWCRVDRGTWIAREPDHIGFYPIIDSVFRQRWSVGDDDGACQRCGGPYHGDLRCEANGPTHA